jgi:hypothetical protein
MKKIWIVLAFLLIVNFVVALEEPSTPTDGEDVEKIENIINNYSPLNDSGDVDFEKYRPIVSKAEVRIDEINLWIEENALWLKVVFGMVPSITLLFAINLWTFLFSFIFLVHSFGLIMSEKKIDLGIFKLTLGHVFGIIIFLILLFTKIFVKLSIILNGLVDVFWNYILPWGFVVAVIIIILVVIAFITSLIYMPRILVGIRKRIKDKKKEKEDSKEAVNRKVLEKFAEGVTAA